ncbi:MAG: hypothetical protein R2911_19320 [Caldilineaceae bacterium]
MLLQPLANTCDRPFVRIWARMRSMKYFNFTKENDSHPASCSLTNFGAEFHKKRLNIAPLNVGTDRVSKDQSAGIQVLSFYRRMVLHFGVTSNFSIDRRNVIWSYFLFMVSAMHIPTCPQYP